MIYVLILFNNIFIAPFRNSQGACNCYMKNVDSFMKKNEEFIIEERSKNLGKEIGSIIFITKCKYVHFFPTSYTHILTGAVTNFWSSILLKLILNVLNYLENGRTAHSATTVAWGHILDPC